MTGQSESEGPENEETLLPEASRNLLIVDDDQRFCDRLARAMERRGFAVQTAYNVADGLALARRLAPRYAVVDLRLDDGSGLEVVQALREAREDARVIVLTGYGNIATAVAAVKVGATEYLPKPAEAAHVEAADAGGDSLGQELRAQRARARELIGLYAD